MPPCVCVCVCVCVCMCVCVYFLSTINKCNVRVQVSAVMIMKILLCQVPLSQGPWSYQLCKRVSIKPGKTVRSKKKLFKTLSKPAVKAQNITTFLLTNLGRRSTQGHKGKFWRSTRVAAQGQILTNCTTSRGVH